MTEIERPLEQTRFSNTNGDKERRRARIMQLSMPKMSKAVWATIEPPLVWGNQDPMSPISKGALNARSSARLTELSTPKKNFQLNNPQKCSRDYFMYSCGRSSVIWQVSPMAMKASANNRIEELSKAKKLAMGYKEDRPGYVLGCGRSSPIWGVSESAMKADDRERTSALSQPKAMHKEYQPAREVEWPVSAAARNASTPFRIENLARPKERKEGSFRFPQWVVSKSARSAHACTRVQELSQPKKLTDGYHPNRDVEWKVPKSSLRAHATERLKELAAPIVRDTMDHVQFDPLAFQVKESALKGKVPDRINDLAQPIIRGPQMSKK